MHSCIYVLITGKTHNIASLVDQALAPFDEDWFVPPHKLHLSESCIRAMAAHYKLPESDLNRLAVNMQDWMRCEGGVDDLGLFAIQTCNPDGKWDWYEIGGRWNGFITGRKQPNGDVIRNNSIPASRLLATRDFAKRLPHGIVTPTGEWIERSTFVTTLAGWYRRETPDDVWCQRVRRILEAFPKHRVVSVDVHN